MLILNMWKEIYENCYTLLCCQYYNLHYNLPNDIDFSNVEYSNLEKNMDIEQTLILDCPGIIVDNNSKLENTRLDNIIEEDYDIIDEEDINI